MTTVPMVTEAYGRSVLGKEITLHRTEDFHAGTLIIAGIHGDERATVALAEAFVERHLYTGHAGDNVAVIPIANPDSYQHNSRYNANGVDINRNFETEWSPESEEPSGPSPYSEPETRALRDLILRTRPARVVTLHWALGELDADGIQSTPLAEAMWNALTPEEKAPYRLRVWEIETAAPNIYSDPCPGSLGQWLGFGLRYGDGRRPAIVTLELPYDPSIPRPAVLPENHLETVRAWWNRDPARYLEGVERGVFKMLLAACHHR